MRQNAFLTSFSLLSYISGMSKTMAKNLVSYRDAMIVKDSVWNVDPKHVDIYVKAAMRLLGILYPNE